eukprot:1332071-Amphidinium_carterae.1
MQAEVKISAYRGQGSKGRKAGRTVAGQELQHTKRRVAKTLSFTAPAPTLEQWLAIIVLLGHWCGSQ